jgi:hypothetical protein
MAADFEAFGGAPEPVTGMTMPLWMAEQIEFQAATQMVARGNALLMVKEARRNG